MIGADLKDAFVVKLEVPLGDFKRGVEDGVFNHYLLHGVALRNTSL
jgi:hypothetical protein